MDSRITAEASPPAETLAEHPVAPQTPPVVAQNPAGVANSSSDYLTTLSPTVSSPSRPLRTNSLTFEVSVTVCSLQVLVFSYS